MFLLLLCLNLLACNAASRGHGEDAFASNLRSSVEQIRAKISVDLLAAAKRELRFLESIIDPALYGQDVLEDAVRRYESCWLPLQAAHPDLELAPPLDVATVWHAHMLSPVAYRKDSHAISGTVVDHRPGHGKDQLSSDAGIAGPHKLSIRLWNEFCNGEPYGAADEKQTEKREHQQKSAYDLVEAARRQRRFAEKVVAALATFSDLAFLERAVERYIRFLQLIQTYPRTTSKFVFVPTTDIDLVWHSHQLHPSAYNRDSVALTNRLINHNDAGDKQKLSKGVVDTEKLWAHHFNEPYIQQEKDDGNQELYNSNKKATLYSNKKIAACESGCAGWGECTK